MRRGGRIGRIAGSALVLLWACGGGEDREVAGDARRTPTTRQATSTTRAGGSPSSTTTTAVAVAADAGSQDGAAGTRTPEPSVGSPTPEPAVETPAEESTGPSRGEPTLRRRDVPPEGVPAQLTFLPPTDGCDVPTAPAPEVTPGSGSLALGQSFLICVRGFATTSLVSVRVNLPDGQTRQSFVANQKDENGWQFGVTTSDPTGTYRITATQGSRVATASFTVVLPFLPVIGTAGPTSGSPGTTFRFAVVSAAPAQDVPLDVYRRNEVGRFSYITTAGTVRTNETKAFYDLTTSPDDPPGEYCLATRGTGSCASFVLG